MPFKSAAAFETIARISKTLPTHLAEAAFRGRAEHLRSGVESLLWMFNAINQVIGVISLEALIESFSFQLSDAKKIGGFHYCCIIPCVVNFAQDIALNSRRVKLHNSTSCIRHSQFR